MAQSPRGRSVFCWRWSAATASTSVRRRSSPSPTCSSPRLRTVPSASYVLQLVWPRVQEVPPTTIENAEIASLLEPVALQSAEVESVTEAVAAVPPELVQTTEPPPEAVTKTTLPPDNVTPPPPEPVVQATPPPPEPMPSPTELHRRHARRAEPAQGLSVSRPLAAGGRHRPAAFQHAVRWHRHRVAH